MLLKKTLWHGCFFVKFEEFLRATFSYRTAPVVASVLCSTEILIATILFRYPVN